MVLMRNPPVTEWYATRKRIRDDIRFGIRGTKIDAGRPGVFRWGEEEEWRRKSNGGRVDSRRHNKASSGSATLCQVVLCQVDIMSL